MNQSLTPSIQEFMPTAVRSGLFVSLATVQKQSDTQGPTGNPIDSWVNLPGVVNIPCMDAPPSIARVQATEMKDVAEIMAKGLRHVLLSSCFLDAQDWAGKGYRVVVDGVTYDLMGAENDSQLTQTRLDLQLVTV